MLVFVFLSLQYRLWLGGNSVSDYMSLSEKKEQLEEANALLLQRNKLMKIDIDDLKNGLDAVEGQARNELGLIKKDEIFFRIIPAS